MQAEQEKQIIITQHVTGSIVKGAVLGRWGSEHEAHHVRWVSSKAAVSPSGVTARDNAGSSWEGPISSCCGRALRSFT